MSSSQDAFKAISDPTRREILRLLGHGPMSAGQIAEHFDIGKPTLSHHLAALREADLVGSERDGQTIWYSLNTTVLQDVVRWALEVANPSRTGRATAKTAKWRRARS